MSLGRHVPDVLRRPAVVAGTAIALTAGAATAVVAADTPESRPAPPVPATSVAPGPPNVVPSGPEAGRNDVRRSGRDPFGGGTSDRRAAERSAAARVVADVRRRTAAIRAATATPATTPRRRATTPTRATTTTTTTARATTTSTPAAAPRRTWRIDRVDVRVSREGRVARLRRDVARLTLLPTPRRPAVLYLGLLADRRTAAFAVPAGARVTGGRCRPSRAACTHVHVRAGRRARLALPDGDVLVRVVRVRTARVRTATAARRHRARESAAGRCLLTALGMLDGRYSVRRGTLRLSRPPERCAS